MASNSLIKNGQNFVSKQLGLGSDKVSNSTGIQPSAWKLNEPEEAFFKPLDIDPSRWDKLYPYRLLVIDITKPNKILGGGSSRGTLTQGKTSRPQENGGFEYVLTQEIRNGSWELNLPITPQMLRIADEFAINTSATMRGIVEEHGGVRFKTITAQGTTGIWPQKPSIGGIPRSPSSLGSIFAGSLSQFNNILGDSKRIARAFSGSYPATTTDAVEPFNDGSTVFSTGYYQALLLGQFLERYVVAKRNPKNKNWRLVFDIPKQNQAFIVTPQGFSLEQNKEKPMEMLWNLQLKAWKRIKLEAPAAGSQLLPELDANVFQRVMGTVKESRRLVGNSINLIKAVRTDFQAPLNVLRQTALLIKDVSGAVISVADLPRQIISDYRSSIRDSLNIIGSSFQRGPGGSSGSSSGSLFTAGAIRADSQEIKAGLAYNQIRFESLYSEGLSNDAVSGGALGLGASQSQRTSATNEFFENPETYFDLFDAVDIDSLSISPEQRQSIDDEIDSTRLITSNDLRNFRQEILTLALDLSNVFGAGSQVYSDVYGRPDPRARTLPMSIEENELLASLFDTIQMYDLLTSTKAFDDLSIQDPMEYVGGLAGEAGIDFDQSESKLLVPIPFGLTIEAIAARYLGNPDKWVEIATLNKLTSPYIDEVGFIYSLLSNGDGRQINVDDTERRFYIGQKITLKSDTVPAFTRKIINIEKIGEGNFLISFDGLDNLSLLTTAGNAKIQGYLPGTVNSQNQIYIPVDAPSDPDDRIRTPSHLDEDNLSKVSKVDFLLDDNGDLAINDIGEFQLANGLTNLIQALKLKIRTKKGTLLRHLEFGLGLSVGISLADIESGEIISALNKMVQDDPRFDAIDSISIRLNGPTLFIDMSVKIAGGSGIVPITFEV